MQRRRLNLIAAGLFTAASIWITPALADMFYYRDAQGQLHLTNVWSRIPSTYRDQAARNRRPEQGGPTSTVDKATKVPSTSLSQPRQDDEVVRRPATVSPHAAPVSTRDFGLLSLRISDYEVLQRLGPPVAVSDVGERALAPADSSNRVIRVVDSNQRWYYPGTTGIPATRLDFQGGVLVHKMRLHR